MFRRTRCLSALLALSGAAALTCEVLWMRRLALATGSSGVAITLTLALYMAGLGLGGAWASRRQWPHAPRGYGLLELGAAAWALTFPFTLTAVYPLWLHWPGLGTSVLAATLLLLPPALLAGATLPAVSGALRDARQVAALYAANTAGAVVGTLAGPFLLLPAFGIRGTEILAALGSASAGLGALWLARRPVMADDPAAFTNREPPTEPLATPAQPRPRAALLAAAIAGGSAMALEVAWTRLGALLIGGSVYAMAAVLAVFLAAVALGAAWGRRWSGGQALGPALVALGLLAAVGLLLYPWLPHGLAAAWVAFGPGSLLPVGALLAALAMAGAPIASGVVFSAALQAAGGTSTQAAGRVLAANTLAGVLGSVAAGLWGLPLMGVQAVVVVVCILTVSVGVVLTQGRWPARVASVAALALLLLGAPPWDASLYAVGLYNRLDEFVDLSPEAIDRFAHQGWELRFYRDGRNCTVAVGESTRTGNRWLSLNGKVDASTGLDMRTQQISGWLPTRVARSVGAVSALESGADPLRTATTIDGLVVGLASGVTAGAAIAEGMSALTVVELEPAVVDAATWFSEANGHVLADPRTTLVVGDARAWLARPGPRYQVIISEPSNPWITGVSNLFTLNYWQLARARLAHDGVFCQWIQLYALPPAALRSLVATFLTVFPRTWLFETIPEADALLIAAPSLPADLGMEPLLGPEALAAFAAGARLNTDDLPWVEFEAPRWLHTPTGAMNRAALLEGDPSRQTAPRNK